MDQGISTGFHHDLSRLYEHSLMIYKSHVETPYAHTQIAKLNSETKDREQHKLQIDPLVLSFLVFLFIYMCGETTGHCINDMINIQFSRREKYITHQYNRLKVEKPFLLYGVQTHERKIMLVPLMKMQL